MAVIDAYRFIEQHHKEFGIRWLLRRLGLCPNAYYNYRKNRKLEYHDPKAAIMRQIEEIYHNIVRPKKPGYSAGKPHKVFADLLAQDFSASASNRKWCTDFTYLFLKGGEVRYNCTIY